MADFSAVHSRTNLLTERTFPLSSSNRVCLPKALLETFPKVPVTQADLPTIEQRQLRAIQDSDKQTHPSIVPSKADFAGWSINLLIDWSCMRLLIVTFVLSYSPDSNKVNFKPRSQISNIFDNFFSQLAVINTAIFNRSSIKHSQVFSSQLENILCKKIVVFCLWYAH